MATAAKPSVEIISEEILLLNETFICLQKNILFRQGYGLTETNGAISIGRNDDTNHASVGHILASSEVKIADLKTQETLGPGQASRY